MKKDRLNEQHITKSGYKITIVEYFNNKNSTIRFDDYGVEVKNIDYRHIVSGSIKLPKEFKIGEKYKTTEGYVIEVIDVKNPTTCTIQFESGLIIKDRSYQSVKKGNVKNPYHPSVVGKGYFGLGIYSSKKHPQYYCRWRNALTRCYKESERCKYPSYKDVTVCEEWHNFQNFAKWCEENYIEGWHLDKDILVKGNKVYSPDTCCFVPYEINYLFTKSDNRRGNYPIGVGKCDNKFTAIILKKRLGMFNTPEEAFEAYKVVKEKHIKEAADKWKDLIDPRVYQAMYRYEVEITD